MSLSTIRDRHVITIPRALRDRFKVGQQVEILPTEDGGAVLRPVKTVPAGETLYTEDDMKELLRLADEARQGENTVGSFSNPDELIAALHKESVDAD